MPLSHAQRAKKYLEKYSQNVIIRDNDLRAYNRFLSNAGEPKPLEEIIHDMLKTKPTIRAMDIGCGNAQALHELKERFDGKVYTIGIDLLPLDNAEMLDEFIQGDVHDSPIPKADLILSFRALHEMGNLADLLPRLAHALSPGGRAYLWIRMREFTGPRASFSGEMNPTEEQTLQTLSRTAELHGCKLLLETIPVTNPSDPDETLNGGYVVFLHKPAQ